MRKLAAALLAVPVLALVYVPVRVRRIASSARVGVAIGVGGLVAASAPSGSSPRAPPPTTRPRPPPSDRAPAEAAFSRRSRTDHGARRARSRSRSAAPMDRDSVARAARRSIRRRPSSSTGTPTGTRVTIAPDGRWASRHLLHGHGRPGRPRRDAAGRWRPRPGRLPDPRRRRPATIAPSTAPAGDAVAASTRRSGRLRPAASTVDRRRAAFQIDPPLAGDARRRSDVAGGTSRYRSRRSSRSTPDTTYTRARSTASSTPTACPLAAAPAARGPDRRRAPAVVRFRPLARHDGRRPRRRAVGPVHRADGPHDATRPRSRADRRQGRRRARSRLAEDDTVLVFEPAALLPYGATVVAAWSRRRHVGDGVPLAAADQRPKSRVRGRSPRPSRRVARPAPSSAASGGGASVAAAGRAVETYYLRLMNCTRHRRLGDVVRRAAAARAAGASPPLKLDSGIASKVARPYAKLLATRSACSHFIGGNPGDRLARAGYTSYIWAENLGCRSGDPYAPCSARTSSSRASGRTTAATT